MYIGIDISSTLVGTELTNRTSLVDPRPVCVTQRQKSQGQARDAA